MRYFIFHVKMCQNEVIKYLVNYLFDISNANCFIHFIFAHFLFFYNQMLIEKIFNVFLIFVCYR